jgi:hypothetical protein
MCTRDAYTTMNPGPGFPPLLISDFGFRIVPSSSGSNILDANDWPSFSGEWGNNPRFEIGRGGWMGGNSEFVYDDRTISSSVRNSTGQPSGNSTLKASDPNHSSSPA